MACRFASARGERFAARARLLTDAFFENKFITIFSLLFAFALTPKASTLSMMFFIVPQGIAQLPIGAKVFGVLVPFIPLSAGGNGGFEE